MPKIGKYWVSKDHYYWPHDTAHTWAKIEDGKIRVGVDDFAQKQAGQPGFSAGASYSIIVGGVWEKPGTANVKGKTSYTHIGR